MPSASTAKYYKDQHGHLITAAEGSIKNTYSFYRVDAKHRSRVRTRPMIFYPSLHEASTALDGYAAKRQWEPVSDKFLLTSNEKTEKTSNFLPLFAWQEEQACPSRLTKPSSQPKTISDSEYEIFKDELVRQAVLVVQTEMKGWTNPCFTRAIQTAVTYLRRSGIWSNKVFSGLHSRLLNDTGKTFGSKYQIENMYGGVYVRVEGGLLK